MSRRSHPPIEPDVTIRAPKSDPAVLKRASAFLKRVARSEGGKRQPTPHERDPGRSFLRLPKSESVRISTWSGLELATTAYDGLTVVIMPHAASEEERHPLDHGWIATMARRSAAQIDAALAAEPELPEDAMVLARQLCHVHASQGGTLPVSVEVQAPSPHLWPTAVVRNFLPAAPKMPQDPILAGTTGLLDIMLDRLASVAYVTTSNAPSGLPQVRIGPPPVASFAIEEDDPMSMLHAIADIGCDPATLFGPYPTA